MARRGALASAVLCVLAVAACSDDPEGVDTFSPSKFPAAYAQALCGSLEHCCSENGIAANYAACSSGWKAYVEQLLAGPSALVNYEPRKAKACVDAVRAAGAVSCDPVPGSISDARDTCLQIFAGKKPLGAPCSAAAECATLPEGGRVGCEIPPDDAVDAGVLPLNAAIGAIAAKTPVCTLLGEAGPGVPCLVSAASVRGSCGEDLFCDPKVQKCAPKGAVGAPCIPGSCAAGGACAAGGPNAGLCVPTSPIGGPCATPEECDGTSRCDAAQGKCVAKKLAPESCGSAVDCAIGICDRGTQKCLKNAIATSNACAGKAE